jgi:hypothetical protein
MTPEFEGRSVRGIIPAELSEHCSETDLKLEQNKNEI